MYTIISIFVLLMIILQIFVHVLHCCQLHHPYLILFPPLPSKGVTINSLPNCLFFPIPSKDLRQILRSIDICCFLLPESITAREKTFTSWFIRCASSVTQQSSSFFGSTFIALFANSTAQASRVYAKNQNMICNTRKEDQLPNTLVWAKKMTLRSS